MWTGEPGVLMFLHLRATEPDGVLSAFGVDVSRVFLNSGMSLAAKERKDRRNKDWHVFCLAFVAHSLGEPSCFSKFLTLSSLRSFAANHLPLLVYHLASSLHGPRRIGMQRGARPHEAQSASRIAGGNPPPLEAKFGNHFSRKGTQRSQK